MAQLDPEEAATIAHGAWAEGKPLSPLTSFAIDTRTMERGQVFIALKTDKRDGHDYLGNARANGALAAIVERPDRSIHLPQLVVKDSLASLHSLARVWRQRFEAPVIGITGSYGKTTVKEMLGTVMGSQWFRTRGNLNNILGVPLSILELETRHDAGAILEAGINTTGEMEILADLIDPTMAVITAVGPAHLEGLGGIEGIAREKSLLAKAVRPGGTVVIPASLLRHQAFREIPREIAVHGLRVDGTETDSMEVKNLPNVSIYHYKWTENEDSRGAGLLSSEGPVSLGGLPFKAASPGMVSNLALVVHVALQLGVPATTIEACLEGWHPFRHRGETYRSADRLYYVDCYNASPGSMEDSVRRFQNLFAGQPQLYVLGSMNELGEASEKWHRQTAARLGLPVEARVLLIGHGADWMRQGLLEAGFPEENVRISDGLDALHAPIEAHKGAVFLKASRSYKLETLLPEGAIRC